MLYEKIIEKVVSFLHSRFSVDGLTRKSSTRKRTSSEKVFASVVYSKSSRCLNYVS